LPIPRVDFPSVAVIITFGTPILPNLWTILVILVIAKSIFVLKSLPFGIYLLIFSNISKDNIFKTDFSELATIAAKATVEKLCLCKYMETVNEDID
jgi:hypothetical protein